MTTHLPDPEALEEATALAEKWLDRSKPGTKRIGMVGFVQLKDEDLHAICASFLAMRRFVDHVAEGEAR